MPTKRRLRDSISAVAGVLSLVLVTACSDTLGPDPDEATPTDAEPVLSLSEAQKLGAGDAEAGYRFGWAASVSGDVALVGAWGDGDAGPFSGSAYVFERSGGGWAEVAKLTAGDGADDRGPER